MTSKELEEERARASAVLVRAFERAAASPEQALAAAKWVSPRNLPRPPAPWRQPDGTMRTLAEAQIARAREAVRRAVAAHGLSNVPTGFHFYPRASFAFTDRPGPDFAPLLATCLDSTLYGGLVRVVTEATGKLTRKREVTRDGESTLIDLYPGEAGDALMERANRFLGIEARLWSIAALGGFGGPVPYPVRYEAARYLWSPRVAGVAFCLRCGGLRVYRRRGRQGGSPRRVSVCGPCLRGGSLHWPARAVMPHARGTWWLRCLACERPFVGRAQARRCPACRLSRITPARRSA